MSVTNLPMLPMGAHGYPRDHDRAFEAAAQEMHDWINELPSDFYHFGLSDAKDVLRIVLARYWLTLRRQG